ncbi:MAG: 50S ribosomal protein L3 N(5)-glutamine methyltransferase [Gammaproteobacteria bacterium]|nr:50S ribosomal protein L3 N(5)-glutamine methyltransferase [Gammaproteobacteria bacterium]MDP2349000.1 50S ribosomal protein L3 N(5)-glutamine methyltransferase [Gammaproteobacteria bacterium]
MMTTLLLRDCIEDASERFERVDLFYGHGTDNSWDEAVYLVFSALGLSFLEDDSVMSRVVTVEEAVRISSLVDRRINEHIPVAYLVGEAWFGGLPFRVDSRVLIPRSPIAELIADRFVGLLSDEPLKILDLCTGSGCIGIACAVAFPAAQIDLADISVDALALARENVRRHEAQGRVSVIQSDLFDQLQTSYDLIVTNPPYVSREEVDELPLEYRHEPELGLVSDDGGLDIPVKILRKAATFLNEGGVLILEVGYSWNALANRFPDVPFLWLEFANGGEGVCMLTRQQLLDSTQLFN